MIDTVVLRIHRIREKYAHLVKYLQQINTNKYVKKFNHKDLQDNSTTSILYGDTGNVLHLTHRSSIDISSSHYSISFLISEEKDFIELNFSLPKYLYTTNLMQFIDHYDLSNRHVFDKFINVITEFFNQYFPISPEFDDIEVNRIDICYNQFFLSKNDALKYLNEQKQLSVRNAKSEETGHESYGTQNGVTTVFYKNERYSFKIYHKGTEFKKNDYLKLIKNNPKGFNLCELRDTADKILRYEMTCRKGLLNYLFKQRLKDDENTLFNHNYQKILATKTKRRNEFVQNMGKVPIYAATKNRTEVFIHKTINNKTYNFTLKSLWDDLNATPSDLMDCYDLPFNYELFEHLLSFFWERVNRYQLGVKMSMKDVFDKIKEHQQEEHIKNLAYAKNDKVSQTGQLLLIATLSQYTDITELKNVLPKATYYRYRDKLKKLGIPEYSPDIAINPPPLDFVTYFYYFSQYHTTYN
jgi:hypothetical protein